MRALCTCACMQTRCRHERGLRRQGLHKPCGYTASPRMRPAMATDMSVRTPTVPVPPDDACFRLAMASAGIGMAIVSLDGAWVEVNPALCRMLGVDAHALIGRNVRELTDPEDAARTEDFFAGLLSGEQPTLDARNATDMATPRVVGASQRRGERDDDGRRCTSSRSCATSPSSARQRGLETPCAARTAELQALKSSWNCSRSACRTTCAAIAIVDSFTAYWSSARGQLDEAGQRTWRASAKPRAEGHLIDGLRNCRV